MFCGKCGAYLSENTEVCETCGTPVTEETVKNIHQVRESVLHQTKSGYFPDPSGPGKPDSWNDESQPRNPHVLEVEDKHGNLIPAEYGPGFNRESWSWPAFIFREYWYCYKGMYIQAWKFILAWLAIIALPEVFPFLGFLSGPLVGGYLILIIHIWAGFVGHRDYSTFMNETPSHRISEKRKIGMGCMISLAVGVIMVIVGLILTFLFILRLGTPYRP